MRKYLVAFAICGAMSGSAQAQAAAQPVAPAVPSMPATPQVPAVPGPVIVPAGPAPAQPPMVKKVVCERIHDEELVGSRIGSSRKVCKTIMVPAGSGGGKASRSTPAPERG